MTCHSWSINKTNNAKKGLKKYKSYKTLIIKYKAFVQKVYNAGSVCPSDFANEMLRYIRTPDNQPIYSIRVGGGMRLTFSVCYDTCIVTIRAVGSHKEAYG